MKNILGKLVLIFGLFAVLANTPRAFAQTAQTQPDNPGDLAKKIADFVKENGAAECFNTGSADAGTFFTVQLYQRRSIYVVESAVYTNGASHLSVCVYYTNRNFDKCKSAADFAAEEIKYGKIGIFVETHMSDRDTNGMINDFQEFTKKHNGEFQNFTREDRDCGEKCGVNEFHLAIAGEKVDLWKNGKKQKGAVNVETLRPPQAEYRETLVNIAELLQLH